jgi:hypothetical protein
MTFFVMIKHETLAPKMNIISTEIIAICGVPHRQQFWQQCHRA